MTQTKTIKEKAVDEGINYLKDNDKIIYQDYDGFKVPDNLIREKDTLVAIKKAVDTYADEVNKQFDLLKKEIMNDIFISAPYAIKLINKAQRGELR